MWYSRFAYACSRHSLPQIKRTVLVGVASSGNVHVNFRDNPSTAPTVEKRDTHKENGDFTSPLIFF